MQDMQNRQRPLVASGLLNKGELCILMQLGH